MKILVTGSNGYIGKYVVTDLLDKGFDVVACDLLCDNIDKRAECYSVDIFNLPQCNLFEMFGRPNVCLHLAWKDGFIHNSPNHIRELSFHYNFITKLIDDGLKHIAIMGTMHEIGYWEGMVDENTPCNPISLYGIAKDTLRKSIMHYVQDKDCTLQWLRGYYIFGDDKRSNSIFGKLLKANDNGEKQFPFTMGTNKYDFIKIEELANLISLVITQNKINGIINICKGEPISLSDKVNQFIKEKKLDIELQYGVFPNRPYDSPCIYGNPNKINEILSSHHKSTTIS